MLRACEGKHVHSGVKVRVKMEKQDDVHGHPLVPGSSHSQAELSSLKPLAWETLQTSAPCP